MSHIIISQRSCLTKLKAYLSITKPGIIMGNSITLMGGFFLASSSQINWILLTLTWLGMALVIACGCVINNYIDRDIDALMTRTQNRPFVLGTVWVPAALIYGIVLGILGSAILLLFTNFLAFIFSLLGLFCYLVPYSLRWKRKSGLGTYIGAIAGAMPPVVGYCALTNRVDLGALILFAMLFLWQIPHFYAIAVFRLADYQSANIPVLPLTHGMACTKRLTIGYIFIFFCVSLLPTLLGYTGFVYLSIALLMGLVWLYLSVRDRDNQSPKIWAKSIFCHSIFLITTVFLSMGFKL